MRLPYEVPDRDAYGRGIIYDVVPAECDGCRVVRPCLSVDTSCGEYCTAYLCLQCIGEMFAAKD